MIACRNCGSRMNFDIKSQQMRCTHCDSLLPVEESDDVLHESIADIYESNVYRCTQCGAELLTQENSAVSFCSFCGAQAVLSKELKRIKRPDYIIPFTKTKEDCKKQYLGKIKKAIYAPGDMRKAKHVDEFRGIYMPYFVYDVEQTGKFNINGTKSYRSGDYIVTDEYTLTGNIRGKYNSITHDASSNFADNISESIAPYDMGEKRFFREGFLHGFYADVADVSEDVYRVDATDMANEYALYNIKRQTEFAAYNISYKKTDEGLSNRFGTGVSSIKSAMFPVWMLSFKRGGRMSYATINGQTGRMYADIPVEPWKFILGSLLLAVPLYFLFQLKLTITPTLLVVLCNMIAFFTCILYKRSIKQIINKSAAIQGGDNPYLKESKKRTKYKAKQHKYDLESSIVGFMMVPIIFIFYGFLWIRVEALENALKFITAAISVGGIVYCAFGQKTLNRAYDINDRIGMLVSIVTFVASAVVVIIAPVDDFWYYLTCYISVFCILISLIALIKSFNILSSRRPRTFVRKGADDYGI